MKVKYILLQGIVVSGNCASFSHVIVVFGMRKQASVSKSFKRRITKRLFVCIQVESTFLLDQWTKVTLTFKVSHLLAIRIIDTQSYECIEELRSHSGSVSSLLYAHDTLYSGSFFCIVM